VLVTKDINLRLKARGCSIEAEDYHSDQPLSDIEAMHKGYIEFENSFWSKIEDVRTEHVNGSTLYHLQRSAIAQEIYPN
jgi:PhoH-like ATPase